MRKNRVDHNASSATTIFDYFDWSRYQGKGEAGHKWLGCMLSATGSKSAILDVDYHLQSASRTFFANKWIFLSRNVSIRNKLKFFNAIVTPIACFGAGPRCIQNANMAKFDINFRRMIRSVVGAPDVICWGDPWHEILHVRPGRARVITNNRLVDLNIENMFRVDDGRIEAVANGLPMWGG